MLLPLFPQSSLIVLSRLGCGLAAGMRDLSAGAVPRSCQLNGGTADGEGRRRPLLHPDPHREGALARPRAKQGAPRQTAPQRPQPGQQQLFLTIPLDRMAHVLVWGAPGQLRGSRAGSMIERR